MPEFDGRPAPTGQQPDTSNVCAAPDPIAIIDEEHALQLELCDVLEFLADCLPDRAEPAVAAVAVTILRNGLPQHMKLEEEVLFPLLRRRVSEATHLAAILERLEDEHEADESFAEEIADALEAIAERGRPDNAEMLGYMLRGFFESQRRHIAWESRVVLPLAREVLAREDLAELQSRIMARGRPECSRQSLLALRSADGATEICQSCAARAQRS